MWFKKRYIIALIYLLLCASCAYKVSSVDFTQENTFTNGIEGPATDIEGNIYAVNFGKQGTIGKISKEGIASVFIELPNGSIGNGIKFIENDKMYVADYINHNILQIDINTREISIFANQPIANQPNDIAVSPNKTLYASDPNWSENTGNLWKITKLKGFELLESNMGTTNGIEVSPDGKNLYVNESIQRNIWVYDITSDNDIKNKRLFIKFEDYGLDGMRCTPSGNLFVCRYDKGSIAILNPKGVLIEEIFLKGKKPTNITFSNDYKIAYVTMADRGCIEKFKILEFK